MKIISVVGAWGGIHGEEPFMFSTFGPFLGIKYKAVKGAVPSQTWNFETLNMLRAEAS